MAKTPENVINFIIDMLEKSKNKLANDIKDILYYKIKETDDNSSILNSWDLSYY